MDEKGQSIKPAEPNAVKFEQFIFDALPKAQRWAMVNALSRFGTFPGLSTVHSSSTDVYPNTPTWTFRNATYTSPYLVFDHVDDFIDHQAHRPVAIGEHQHRLHVRGALGTRRRGHADLPRDVAGIEVAVVEEPQDRPPP